MAQGPYQKLRGHFALADQAPNRRRQTDAPRGGDALQHGNLFLVHTHQDAVVLLASLYVAHTPKCSTMKAWSQASCAASPRLPLPSGALGRRGAHGYRAAITPVEPAQDPRWRQWTLKQESPHGNGNVWSPRPGTGTSGTAGEEHGVRHRPACLQVSPGA